MLRSTLPTEVHQLRCESCGYPKNDGHDAIEAIFKAFNTFVCWLYQQVEDEHCSGLYSRLAMTVHPTPQSAA